MTPYSALASGRLTKKPGEDSKRMQEDSYAKFKYDATKEQDGVIIGRVQELAEKRGVSMTEISLAWLLTKVTSPVVGATKFHHIEDIQMSLAQIKETGIWHQKFYTESDTALCMVDLNDVAEAVAVIAGDIENHAGATYELCGTQNLKLDDVLDILHRQYNREISAEHISDQAFLDGLKKSGASEYKQDMMIKMFHHYNDHDFIGNARVLTSLLGRKPHTLLEYFQFEGREQHT